MSLLPFSITPMQPADIPQVVAVEQASYTLTWPKKAYDHELKQNHLAHYFVLRVNSSALDLDAPIIGLGGFWLMANEIHITTIAIYPTWRRLGLGEWMLLNLVAAGLKLEAVAATLEVRPSNQAAIALYKKYNFQEAGRRLRYYTDNGEDALIYTTPNFKVPDYQAMLHQRKAAMLSKLAQININLIKPEK